MFRQNLYLKLFGLFKVPLISWVGARVVEMDERRCVIRIPLERRTKNHLGSLYFGVLAVGADVAGGLMAADRIRRSGQPINLVFKDFKAEFHKRPEGATYFTCEDGEAIGAMIDETLRTGERVHRTVRVVATVPDKLGAEPVATFDLTLSLKHKPRG
jgi:acyl-coenzyme A thioesterase PaaI-like protein